MVAYAATVTSTMRHASKIDAVTGFGMYVGKCDVTNYNQTLAEITGITGKFRTLMQVIATTISDNGYLMRWDAVGNAFKVYYPTATYTPILTGTAPAGTVGVISDTNDAATIGHALYVVPDPGPPPFTPVVATDDAGLVHDDDTAASAGVAVYVVVDDVEFVPGFQLGHLEFVSPTNAHGTCVIKSGGATLLLEDDDAAASNGVVVRAIAAKGGLEADLPGTVGPCLVPLSDGTYVHIADSTTGSTPTVYFDEDAGATHERLMAVVVDNADEEWNVAKISHLVSRSAPAQGMLAKLVTIGPGATLSVGAVGNGGPTFNVLHDQAAANMPGAATLNAIAAGAGFDAAVGGGQDVYIPVSDGEFIKVTYAVSPSGVQVFWDHDATNNYERMLEVVVDNLDEAYTTEAAVGWVRDTPAGTINAITAAAGGQVASDVDVGVVEFIAIGLI